MLVVTYRDDEVGTGHPLRFVLGDLPQKAVKRLSLPPLSEDAVTTLARRAGCSLGNLYAITGGNPFFVTEALAGKAPEGAPPTVCDAVLARAARLSPAARSVMELVSVVPARAEMWLLEAIANPAPNVVEECVGTGMLQTEARTLSFRHELARIAVEDSLTCSRRQSLHTQVLKALCERTSNDVQVARLVHHADNAGDRGAVLRFAPKAARQAAALSAHREAASHYETALRYAQTLPPGERAELLEGRSYECYLTHQMEEARQARLAALAIWKDLGRRDRQGDSLRWISRLSHCSSHKAEAERSAIEAVTILEGLPPGSELAMAYGDLSRQHMLAQQTEEAVHWGMRACELAEKLGATDVLVPALTNVGSARALAGDKEGFALLERSFQLSLTNDLADEVSRAYENFGYISVHHRDYERALSYLNEGISYTTERDIDNWTLHILVWRIRAYFEQGLWAKADEDLSRILERHSVDPYVTIPALTALGHLRVRRGDPDAMAALTAARDLVPQTGILMHVAPLAVAHAEAAWWSGDITGALDDLGAAYDLAKSKNESRALGELAFWIWRAGAVSQPLNETDPYALQLAGDWRRAADMWGRIGCPYEQATALADGEEAAQLRALEIFEQLGAHPAAEALRQKLRSSGVRGIPRGPRPATKENPAGLTTRQMEVLALLAEGLSNTEIANRLYISPKTVDHHVSAILGRLDAHSRAEASVMALQRGLIYQK
jgi:DNA-binding CsgD family transcriptional regulator/tetratricopeptide (TPR) repeat protein